jgi:hypothetical protein
MTEVNEASQPLKIGMYERAYLEISEFLDTALGTEEEDGAGEGLAGDVRLLAAQRNEARAELERLRNGGRELGKTVVRMSRSMRAARIEMLQNGPEKAMQWILNSLPDVDDNDPADHWDGKESAAEWLDRTAHLEAPGE